MFWIIAILMLLAGLALVTPSLLTRKSVASDDNREQNITIARERMQELKVELDNGVLSESSYKQSLDELEKTLLSDVEVDVEDDANPSAAAFSSGMIAVVSVLVIVSAISFGLYNHLGSPQYLGVSGPGKPAQPIALETRNDKTPTVDEMISGLQKKLQDNPADPDGWYLLGRLYASIERFSDSVAAYEKLVEVSDRQPTALVMLADSLAMTQDGSLSGRPIELISEALGKDPDHVTALWMAGQAAANDKQYLEAIDYWRRAVPGLEENREMQTQLRSMIDEAVVLARESGLEVEDVPEIQPQPQATPASAAFAITISVDSKLEQEIMQGDVLFLFARLPGGPPMPVAAIKMPARGFPLEILLDDSAMLQPGATLTQYEKIVITARISRSGEPMAQSGDLQSQPLQVSTGTSETLDVIINQRLP